VLTILLVLFSLSILPLVRRNVIASAVLSGVLVNLAAIGKRYLIAVPSQTHGTLLPYSTGSYSPTWVEYSIILGLFALGTLLYVLFIKVFPIMEVTEPVGGDRFEGDRL
jgi:molybdopterin-containing oxidoreductase family membrane subunit